MTDSLPEAAAAPGIAPLCAICGKPATCIGRYEHPDNPVEYACDECCGHGNEDGHCEPIKAAPGIAPREPLAQLRQAVMLAIVNIDCERNGLTPDGNVRQRLVQTLNETEAAEQEIRTLKSGLEMWHGKFLAMVEQMLSETDHREQAEAREAALREQLSEEQRRSGDYRDGYNDKDAELAALREQLEELTAVAKCATDEVSSERQRRVAAQEAITLTWEPETARLRTDLEQRTSSPPWEAFCIKCHHRWEVPPYESLGATYCGDCHRAALANETQARNADMFFRRANEEIGRRQSAEIAFTQSEQRRLILIDRAEQAEAREAALREQLAKYESRSPDGDGPECNPIAAVAAVTAGSEPADSLQLATLRSTLIALRDQWLSRDSSTWAPSTHRAFRMAADELTQAAGLETP